jgi:protoheme IX farnesyltransferase
VVARKILGYSYVMVAATLALAPYSGWIYGCCALGLGGWFLAEAHRLRGRIAVFDQAQSADETGLRPVSSDGSAPAPMRLFHLSIAYLTLLFAVVAVTAVLYPLGRW